MIINGYVACICEGSSERAIVDLLLDHHKLIFDREQMLDHEVLRCRSPREFESRYLGKEYKSPINVIRILDSRREQFHLRKTYQSQVKVFNVITAPEIERLIIIAEGKQTAFERIDMKPSTYCKSEFGFEHVKNYQFVSDYFTDIDRLIRSIQEYKRITKNRKNEYMLYDLLR